MKVVQKNKGFTLTELIAVIVILAVLISISSVVFINVRKNILKSQYEELVTYLEAKAVEYANDTNITTISVEDLIKEGYVTPDDQNIIYNPETKESMNCYIIKSTFTDGNFEAKLDKDLKMEDGKTCKTYTKTSELQICVVDGNTCKSFNGSEWFGNNVTLGVLYSNETIKSEATYNWISSGGLSGTESTLTTKTESISEDTVKCTVTFDDIQSETKKNVRIDRESPFVIDVKIDKQYVWAANNKDVTINVADGAGSGVDKIYVVKSALTSCSGIDFTENVTNNTYKTKLDAGDYSVCVKDKVGNVSNNVYTFKVEMVDKTPSDPNFSASDGLGSNSYHSSDYTLSWQSSNDGGSQDLIYYYGTNPNALTNTGTFKYISKDSSFYETYYVKACTRVTNLCSNVKSYIANNDIYAPVISLTNSSSSCARSHTIRATITDNDTGVVAYAITSSSSTPSSWTSINKNKTYNLSMTINGNVNQTYYIHAKDDEGNTSYVYYGTVCVDTNPPEFSYSTSFDCDYGAYLYVNYCSDINGCNYSWTVTNYSWTPSYFDNYSGPLTGDNYLWIQVCDNLGNCNTYQKYLNYCYSYVPDPDPDPDPDPGGGGTGGGGSSGGSEMYDAYDICTNTPSCSSNGYGEGECGAATSSNNMCYGKSSYYCRCCSTSTTWVTGFCWT